MGYTQMILFIFLHAQMSNIDLGQLVYLFLWILNIFS